MEYTKQITDDTVVGFDPNGTPITADRLSKWAYRQLAAAPEMYEALKEMLHIFKRALPEGSIGAMTCNKAQQALARVNGETKAEGR
jgi:hypothetical protein